MQTTQEDKEAFPLFSPNNGTVNNDSIHKNGLDVTKSYSNGHANGAASPVDDETEVDGKHPTENNFAKHNGNVLQKIRAYRNAHLSSATTQSRVPLSNDASDAFPFGIGSTSRNQQYAPTARAPPNFFSDTYFMSHERRGDCIIINNRKFEPHLQLNERKGSDRDATLLKFRFEELGFRVHTLVDATVKDMVEITQYVAEVDQSNADCFIMVVLSHGDDNGIYGVDGRIVPDKLYEPFKGDKCLSLAGKPKIFLTQACRGDRLDAGVDMVAEIDDIVMEQADAVTFQRIPREADFLYSFSTVPGYYSWRNTENGSWYVQCLCAELQKHARDPAMDFVRLLTRVNRRVAMEFESNTPSINSMHKKKQVPSIVSTLTKDLILNVPKTEEDEEEAVIQPTQQMHLSGPTMNNVAVSHSYQSISSSTAQAGVSNVNYYAYKQQQVAYSTAALPSSSRTALGQPPKPPTRTRHHAQQRRGIVVVDSGNNDQPLNDAEIDAEPSAEEPPNYQ